MMILDLCKKKFNIMSGIAVVGCGHWGKNLVRNFSELGVLRYVCDVDCHRVDTVAREYGVAAVSFDDVLTSDVIGVVIATPAVQHYALAKAAFEANKHEASISSG